MSDAMEAEFDVLATWTSEAVRGLGEDDALAACQRSATPERLDRLVRACGLTVGSRLLDVGAGTGGPGGLCRGAIRLRAAARRADGGAVPGRA